MPGWILKSTDPDTTYRIPPSSVRNVGRSARAEFILEAALVSRLHCRLTTDADDRLIVEDLDSTNGVQVNGEQVARAELKAGDTLTIGRVEFAVEHNG